MWQFIYIPYSWTICYTVFGLWSHSDIHVGEYVHISVAITATHTPRDMTLRSFTATLTVRQARHYVTRLSHVTRTHRTHRCNTHHHNVLQPVGKVFTWTYQLYNLLFIICKNIGSFCPNPMYLNFSHYTGCISNQNTT